MGVRTDLNVQNLDKEEQHLSKHKYPVCKQRAKNRAKRRERKQRLIMLEQVMDNTATYLTVHSAAASPIEQHKLTAAAQVAAQPTEEQNLERR